MFLAEFAQSGKDLSREFLDFLFFEMLLALQMVPEKLFEVPPFAVFHNDIEVPLLAVVIALHTLSYLRCASDKMAHALDHILRS